MSKGLSPTQHIIGDDFFHLYDTPVPQKESSRSSKSGFNSTAVRPGVIEEATVDGCRCAADQWEGVLRSVDRAFYLEGRMQNLERLGGERLRAAEMETNTAMHYDYSNGLFASHDYDTGVNTIIDYNAVCKVIIRFYSIKHIISYGPS